MSTLLRSICLFHTFLERKRTLPLIPARTNTPSMYSTRPLSHTHTRARAHCTKQISIIRCQSGRYSNGNERSRCIVVRLNTSLGDSHRKWLRRTPYIELTNGLRRTQIDSHRCIGELATTATTATAAAVRATAVLAVTVAMVVVVLAIVVVVAVRRLIGMALPWRRQVSPNIAAARTI